MLPRDRKYVGNRSANSHFQDNPLKLTVAKSGLKILMRSLKKKHSSENISMRNVI